MQSRLAAVSVDAVAGASCMSRCPRVARTTTDAAEGPLRLASFDPALCSCALLLYRYQTLPRISPGAHLISASVTGGDMGGYGGAAPSDTWGFK